MNIEISEKCNRMKGKQSGERQAYRIRYRIKRFDTRLGTLYMLLHKSRSA